MAIKLRSNETKLTKSANGILERNADGDYYLLSNDRSLVNRMDSFTTTFQLAVYREAGVSESEVR